MAEQSEKNITVDLPAEKYLKYISSYHSLKTITDKKKMLYSHLLPFFGGLHPDYISLTLGRQALAALHAASNVPLFVIRY